MMDIDNFKRLNDRYGHGAGDLCLKRMAAILVAELGAASEGAVRYGGEEFLVVLPGCSWLMRCGLPRGFEGQSKRRPFQTKGQA